MFLQWVCQIGSVKTQSEELATPFFPGVCIWKQGGGSSHISSDSYMFVYELDILLFFIVDGEKDTFLEHEMPM